MPGEVAQQLRVHVVIPEDWSSVPTTHIGWLTTAKTPAPETPKPLASTSTHTHVHSPRPQHTHIIVNNIKKIKLLYKISRFLFSQVRRPAKQFCNQECVLFLSEFDSHFHIRQLTATCNYTIFWPP